MENLTLECFRCSNEYKTNDSDASTKYMYCSKACEDAEDARIKEGNEIVQKANELNPLFEQEQRQQDLKHMPFSTLLNFNKKEN